MWILGIAGSHNSGAALIRDGKVVVAVQTERLSRLKRHPIHLPAMGRDAVLVIQYCLRAAGIDLPDLDAIATCSPYATRARFELADPSAEPPLLAPFVSVPHHLAHAEYVIHYAPPEPSLVLVCDGSGTYESHRGELDLAELEADPVRHCAPDGKESISAYRYDGRNLRLVHRIALGPAPPPPGVGDHFTWPPDRLLMSLGHLWEWTSLYCHGSPREAGKVMGLAPFGDPQVHGDLDTVTMTADSEFRIDFPGLYERFRQPNLDGCDVTGMAHYEHLAAHVQDATNSFLCSLVESLIERAGTNRVCYSGGVALNSIANEHLARKLGVELHMNGSCEDNGTAIGAALAVYHAITATRITEPVTDYYGREYRAEEIRAAVARSGLRSTTLAEAETISSTADALASGSIVGWFQGCSEFGPRALGNRSILADPRGAETQRTLNERVKGREAFRPFAPAVLEDRAAEWFDLEEPSPMMLRVVPVLSDRLPAVTHVDGTARVQTVNRSQNPRFYDLLAEFGRRTGVAVLLNTSFNRAGEPIVESPDDALRTFVQSGMDVLVLADEVVRK